MSMALIYRKEKPLSPALILSLLLLPCILLAKPASDPLQAGFDSMYNLAFDEAHRSFESFERSHPDDPRAPAFDAAAYLFSEFDRLHILQSEFFVDDRNFLTRTQLHPDPKIKAHFEEALNLEDKIANERLKQSAGDDDALFARALNAGLRADYSALIEKRNMQALNEVKDARTNAQLLLSRNPNYFDAYLALGIENYLLSQKAAPVRWLLHMGGAQTDKETGIANLRITAQKGHYLQPYAELLLAVAALRDKNGADARKLLSDLAARFPRNALYREELKKIPG